MLVSWWGWARWGRVEVSGLLIRGGRDFHWRSNPCFFASLGRRVAHGWRISLLWACSKPLLGGAVQRVRCC